MATTKKPKKPKKTKPAKPPARSKALLPTPPPAAPKPTPVAVTSTPPPPAPPVTKLRPAARFRRTSLTPAAQRGADLVRFLRIHSKKPYGVRGINAIAKLAREVGHLANAELDATPQHN
jgi:hypothetical protein